MLEKFDTWAATSDLEVIGIRRSSSSRKLGQPKNMTRANSATATAAVMSQEDAKKAAFSSSPKIDAKVFFLCRKKGGA